MSYKVNPPVMPGPNWAPREIFSPSGIVQSIACLRAWAYAYLFGLRRKGSGPGALLGSIIHACLESYLSGGNVYQFTLEPRTLAELNALDADKKKELLTRAPQCALAGVPYLPAPDDAQITQRINEGVIRLDTAALCPELALDPVVVEGRFDFAIERGEWYLYDHKSTSGKKAADGQPFDPWGYAHTPETLAEDPPALIYALAFMQQHGLRHLWLRWIYYLTTPGRKPEAKVVDVRLERADVEARVRELIYRAAYLRGHVRFAILRRKSGQPLGLDYVETLALPALPPAEDSPCPAYGGCQYSAANAGPCHAPTSNIGAIIASVPATNTTKKKDKTMTQALPALPPGYSWQTQHDGTVLPMPDAAATAAVPVPVAPVPVAPVPVAPVGVPMQPPETAVAPTAAPAPVAASPAKEKAARNRKAKPETASQHEAVRGLAALMRDELLRTVEFHTDGSIAAVTAI